MSVILETTIGDFTIDLYTEARPRTCMNFIKLCKMKYYNHNLFYSIERDFIAQTGDPTGTGKGGESIFRHIHGGDARFYEGEKMPIIRHQKRGTVSMVSCGKDMYGSQFFLTLGEHLDSLDDEHLVFGEVVEDMELLSHLNQTLIDETKRPYKDIRITHTVVLFDPFPDPDGLIYPSDSPLPPKEMFSSLYIAADEDLDEDKSKSMAEIQEEIAAKEASARATILEMVGDIPDAEMAPPENVLFVCKLNAVTTSEDLEIIFSRFGKIKCVEVIKDKLTGNSLQYAFVEFENAKNCEDAFFKMDNVLIDDRRIHVDFSQSVAKIKWKGKGRGVEYYNDSGQKVSKLGNGNYENYSTTTKSHHRNFTSLEKFHHKNYPSSEKAHHKNYPSSEKARYKNYPSSEKAHHENYPSSEKYFNRNYPNSEKSHPRSYSRSEKSHHKSSYPDHQKQLPESSKSSQRNYSHDNQRQSKHYENIRREDSDYKNLQGDKQENKSAYQDDYGNYNNKRRNLSPEGRGSDSPKDTKTHHRSRKTVKESESDSSSCNKKGNDSIKHKIRKKKAKSHNRHRSSSSESSDSDSLSLSNQKDRKKLIKQLKLELKKSKKSKH